MNRINVLSVEIKVKVIRQIENWEGGGVLQVSGI